MKKISNLESELLKIKEENDKNLEKQRAIIEKNNKNEEDILKLVMENIVLKIENESYDVIII